MADLAVRVLKAEEVSAVNVVAIALDVMVILEIPVSILLCSSFVKAFSNSVALLLNIVGLVIEVTRYGELSHIVSLSLTEGCVALLSSNVLGSVGH